MEFRPKWRPVLAFCAAALPLACGLAALVEPAGPGSVRIEWQADSVFRVGDTALVNIVVRAGTTVIERPRLRLTALDPSVVALSPGSDSVFALSRGRAAVSAHLDLSILGAAGIDTVFDLRVVGGF